MKIEAIIEDCPIIPCIRNIKGLEYALASDLRIVQLAYGDLLTVTDKIKSLKDAGKVVFVNIDSIDGCVSSAALLDYLTSNSKIDGIATTKSRVIRAARSLGLKTIIRYFIVDAIAYSNLEKQLQLCHPDFIEILPAWPKIIEKVRNDQKIPVIAGGLIEQKVEIIQALKVGALSVSSSNPSLWTA